MCKISMINDNAKGIGYQTGSSRPNYDCRSIDKIDINTPMHASFTPQTTSETISLEREKTYAVSARLVTL